MRLWHKDLIQYLPKNQLLGQWRECCLIARSISIKGTPNHILVNKIMDYPIQHFIAYARLVQTEMLKRGYVPAWWSFIKWLADKEYAVEPINLFYKWHNNTYLRECFYNLEEKYMCGGISEDDWYKIDEAYRFASWR